MSVLGPERNYEQLTPEQRETAWSAAYRHSLDGHPDREIAWEAKTWRDWGVDAVAAIGDSLLAERQAAAFRLPDGADAASLDRLIARTDQQSVLRLVRDEGLCLLAAMRLVYWAGLREATL